MQTKQHLNKLYINILNKIIGKKMKTHGEQLRQRDEKHLSTNINTLFITPGLCEMSYQQ
jgi:hypothetical protein